MAPDRVGPLVVGLFRIIVGLLFACHGAASLFGVFGGPEGGGPGPAAFVWPSWWAAAIQLVCGVLAAVGLGTRLSALVASGSMAFAYFDVHQRHALLPIQNHGEPAVMFCWAFLVLVVTGAGAFSLDGLLRRSARTPGTTAATATATAATASATAAATPATPAPDVRVAADG
ncbi:DoxX family protein [Actinacidiphila yeochonensis]|uniref:DoxX family protein n=1 Tax=Actinacidiphila yeochonensis TaxID=89050 RepID=UPI001E377965|nr:DoxX family protein [Actinacidiphila yeochonensis]